MESVAVLLLGAFWMAYSLSTRNTGWLRFLAAAVAIVLIGDTLKF